MRFNDELISNIITHTITFLSGGASNFILSRKKIKNELQKDINHQIKEATELIKELNKDNVNTLKDIYETKIQNLDERLKDCEQFKTKLK